jgi:hypothetical protein
MAIFSERDGQGFQLYHAIIIKDLLKQFPLGFQLYHKRFWDPTCDFSELFGPGMLILAEDFSLTTQMSIGIH